MYRHNLPTGKKTKAPSVIFKNNNTVNNSDHAISNVQAGNYEVNNNNTNHFNPVEKMAELYERLLEKEKEEKLHSEKGWKPWSGN